MEQKFVTRVYHLVVYAATAAVTVWWTLIVQAIGHAEAALAASSAVMAAALHPATNADPAAAQAVTRWVTAGAYSADTLMLKYLMLYLGPIVAVWALSALLLRVLDPIVMRVVQAKRITSAAAG